MRNTIRLSRPRLAQMTHSKRSSPYLDPATPIANLTSTWTKRKIYWTNPGTQTIQRARLWTEKTAKSYSDLEDDVKHYFFGPRAGDRPRCGGRQPDVLDRTRGRGRFKRADLDGENREILFCPAIDLLIYPGLSQMTWTDVQILYLSGQSD